MERGLGPNVIGTVGWGDGSGIDVAGSQARERRGQRVLVGRAVGVLVHRGPVLEPERRRAELTVIDQFTNVPVCSTGVVDQESVGAVDPAAVKVGERLDTAGTGRCCRARCRRGLTEAPSQKTSCW